MIKMTKLFGFYSPLIHFNITWWNILVSLFILHQMGGFGWQFLHAPIPSFRRRRIPTINNNNQPRNTSFVGVTKNITLGDYEMQALLCCWLCMLAFALHIHYHSPKAFIVGILGYIITTEKFVSEYLVHKRHNIMHLIIVQKPISYISHLKVSK